MGRVPAPIAALAIAVLFLTSAPAVPASTAQSDPAGQVAEATAAALQEFWRAELPAAFGREWRDISSFLPVETQDPATPPPPCVNRVEDPAL